ncbi:hypothetical protein BT96DRAFT_1003368 [Gymnopus androsaceus JB14]|uniref:Uncharacterized protein n=1 Tax=Gymnopus androsaceus JB14 TaxID=1447944 RepID=A0A6A4GV38_9AGAR|nr:hypothetical protein BT96DRAFT_1003368 [Gymnopus androsaceus JB14]
MATDNPKDACNRSVDNDEIPELIPYEQWTCADCGDSNAPERPLSPVSSESAALLENDLGYLLRRIAAREITEKYATQRKGPFRICYTHGENSLSCDSRCRVTEILLL